MKNTTTATLADIARLAGVSISTVSRALQNSPRVKPETIERIKRLADENNFKLNTTAQKLRTKRTNVIAVVVVMEKDTNQRISDPFILEMLANISEHLEKNNYDMLLINSSHGKKIDLKDYLYASHRADGVILLGQGKNPNDLENLHKVGFPMVIWGVANSNQQPYCFVSSDNRKGGLIATNELIKQGCKNILFLGDFEYSELEQRLLGYKDALDINELAFVEDNALLCDLTAEDGYQALQARIAKNGIDFDGIFAASDMLAMGCIKALNEAKIAIPEQVAIIGYDDIVLSRYTFPPVSTIRQNVAEASNKLVNSVMAQIANKDISSESVGVSLIRRASSEKITSA